MLRNRKAKARARAIEAEYRRNYEAQSKIFQKMQDRQCAWIAVTIVMFEALMIIMALDGIDPTVSTPACYVLAALTFTSGAVSRIYAAKASTAHYRSHFGTP